MSVRAVVVGALGLGSLLGVAACSVPVVSPGEPQTQTREVEGLDRADGVRLGASGDVTVRVGDTPSVTVTAGERVIDRLETEVVDGVLVIDLRGLRGNIGRPEVELVLTEVRTVELDGSGRIDVSPVTTDLVVGLDGSGDVELHDVDADRLSATLDGSGLVRATGSVADLSLELDGSGTYLTEDLVARRAVVDLAGSGAVHVRAEEDLDVRLSGAGTVRYSGDADVRSDVDGIGRVVRAD